MKTPIDTITGEIVNYDERTGTVTIRASYPDWPTMVRREYSKVLIQMVDGRPLSDKQRRACYALLRDISDYTGQGTDSTKEYMKLKFLAEDLGETAEKIFSLSNAPMSLVCAFQRFLVRFILDWDIPTQKPLLGMVDDINDYVYACLIHKKCCICGGRADLHHVSHVGMGRNREEIIHEGMECMPLCREHHQEAHQIGQETFNEKWHIPGGIEIDRTICKIYGLKARRNNDRQSASA